MRGEAKQPKTLLKFWKEMVKPVISHQKNNLSRFAAQDIDHLGLVAGMCKELDIAGIIDREVGTQAHKNLIWKSCCMHDFEWSWVCFENALYVFRIF